MMTILVISRLSLLTALAVHKALKVILNYLHFSRLVSLTVLLTLIFTSSYGQGDKADTLRRIEGYKQWTKERTSLRIGLGTQGSFYSEIGISRLKYIYNDLGYGATNKYVSTEWTPNRNVWGFKGGYEMNLRVLAIGIEGKYQTDFGKSDFVITPKIGLGVIGMLNLFYGYNISTHGRPFDNVAPNQFSLNVNLNRQFLRRNK